MRNKFDNFLLSILWLTIALLGTCFWLNIKFGFNMFSKANWEYLAYMQATQQPISHTFYTSLIVSVFISIFGLYILLRPRRRKIKLTVKEPTTNKPTNTPNSTSNSAQQAQITNSFAPALERPKRLNTQQILPVPTSTSSPQSNTITSPAANIPFTAPTEPIQKWNKEEISEIFKSAGYTIKSTPKIRGLQTALFAIGKQQTVWIGATDCEPQQLQNRIEVIQQVFTDTLEDIEITINGFILNTIPQQSTSNILAFDNIESLRDYISKHPSEPPNAEEQEIFEEFSNYITTVIDYIGRI